MDEATWLQSNDSWQLFSHLRQNFAREVKGFPLPGWWGRRFRLLAAAIWRYRMQEPYAKELKKLRTDKLCSDVLSIAESVADGHPFPEKVPQLGEFPGYRYAPLHHNPVDAAAGMIGVLGEQALGGSRSKDEFRLQCHYMRCIWGNVFDPYYLPLNDDCGQCGGEGKIYFLARPYPPSEHRYTEAPRFTCPRCEGTGKSCSWLRWNGGTLPKIAEEIYLSSEFGDVPILLDAMIDAGIPENDVMFRHLSDPASGHHVKGCWALDMLRDMRTTQRTAYQAT